VSANIRIAILDDQISAQFSERPTEAQGLDIAWRGTDYDELVRFTGTEPVNVIVVDLAHLGDDPVVASERLLASSSAELLITVYQFAPRAMVERLGGEQRRVLKAPVSLAMLKTQMMGTIVRGLLGAKRPPSSSGPVAVRRSRDALTVEPAYTDAQLGLLRERKSRLACECPNHVAELVSSLVAFERYSRACANRDDDDAKMHRALASATAQARRTMEAALTELLHFEKIEV